MKNLKRTNTNEFKKRSFKYLINCLRDEDTETAEPGDVLNSFLSRFNTEFNYLNNQKRYPNKQDRIAQYLMGLPTNLPFSYYDIIKDAKELHQAEQFTEKEEDAIIEKHWNFWANQILIMKDLNDSKKLNQFIKD